MTDARLSAALVEVAFVPPPPTALVSGVVVEVAYTQGDTPAILSGPAEGGSDATGSLAYMAPEAPAGSAYVRSDATGLLVLSPLSATGSASGNSSANGAAIIPVGTEHSREGGRRRRGSGTLAWSPPVVRPVTQVLAAQNYSLNQKFKVLSVANGRPELDIAEHRALAWRVRVVVDGVDISFFRGVPTPEPEYQLQEPLLYGPANVRVPSVSPAYEVLGVGDLSWARKGANVEFQAVRPGSSPLTVYKGVVVAFSTGGPELALEIGGEAIGRAALMERPPPLFYRRNDIGFWWWGLLKDLRLPFSPRLGPDTGIVIRNAGGMSYLEYALQLSSKGTRLDGGQWTCMPDPATGVYSVSLKNRSAIDATAYPDDARVIASLRTDAAEQPNEVFSTGVAPSGMRVKFGAYPVLKDANPPDYPFASKDPFGPGTTDAETDSGDGITVMIWRLQKTGYLDFSDTPGGYDGDAAAAIRALKRDAGTAALFTDEGPRYYDAAFRHNRPFAKDPADPDYPYQTGLTSGQEATFEGWVRDYDIPFDLDAHIVDYDMRGFWLQDHPTTWTAGDHFPDKFKTPYDTTFSNESKYATDDNPFYWHGDFLVDERNGRVVYADPGSMGAMDLATWKALFDVSATGYSIAGSKILPAARDPRTDPWLRTASGAVIGTNPSYDPSVLVVSRSVDQGVDMTRNQQRNFAQAIVNENVGNQWAGTIVFHTGGLVRGFHTPSSSLNDANFMHALELRPGMNLWLPHFDGGTIVHVSGVSVGGDGEVTAAVDTRARDAMEVWEVIARNRESRRDPARSWLKSHRSSALTKDAIIEFDEVGGVLEDGLRLPGGQWTVFPVVAGQEGTIGRLHLQTVPATEYCVAVFGNRIGPGKLRKLVGDPLSTSAHARWTDQTVRNNLQDEHQLLYVAGSHDNPCGYWPKDKVNDATGTTTTTPPPLTGEWQDDAGFEYRAFKGAVIWVAVWPDHGTKLQRGRIMWPRLEAGS